MSIFKSKARDSSRKKKKKPQKSQPKNNKNKNKKSKSKQISRVRDSYLAPSTGYDFTGSFIKTGNRYATILKVVNRFGTNREHQFGWFVNVIPEITIDGVKAYMFESDKPLDQKTQSGIFKKEVNRTIRAQDQSNDTKGETKGDRRNKELMTDDLEYASSADAANKLVIDTHVYVMLTGENPDDIEEQVHKLNTLYNDNMNGLQLQSVAGDQEPMFRQIFDKPKGSVYDFTFMSPDFAGNDHAVRKGLDDTDGAVPIGELTNSYASGTANMSLHKKFDKRVLVAAHPESFINGYDKELSAPSMWGQRIANNVMVHDKKVFHIVLNNFKYYAEPRVEGQEPKFACEPIMNTQLEHIDLSKGGLNPLEMFGDIEDVIEIYNTNQDKLVEMFYLMSGRALDSSQRIALKEAINEFYLSRKLWIRDAHKTPKRTRVLGIKDHASFPLMGDFVTELVTLVKKSTTVGTEKDVDNAKLLYGILKDALDSYRGIFNEPTTLTDPKDIDKMQIYYELGGLRHTPNVQEAQFLNAFDYIAHAATRDDVIMIHGVDKLSLGTLDVIQTRLEKVIEKGVRIGYLFDKIGAGTNANDVSKLAPEERAKVRANVFNTDGLLYQNIDQQFSYTILGTMSNDELIQYQSKVKQKLTRNLKETLTASNAVTQYQVRRQSDLTTVLILGDFLV